MTTDVDEEGVDSGYLLFSIDTELAWGYHNNFSRTMFPGNGEQERATINRILDMLDEFNIIATWALVGHLFYYKCEKCDVCPVLNWKGKYNSFEEIYDTDSQWWYGADVFDTIVKRGHNHEIAFHGYTHQVFDETRMTRQDARIEIQEWIRAAKVKNIVPKTVIFPQNQIGYLDLFEEHGFLCYRGDELLPKYYYSLPIIGKILNRFDLILQIRDPEIYPINQEPGGLINLPASRSLFRMKRKVDSLLHWLDLDNIHIKKNIEGIQKAARDKKIIHLYTHPYEFQSENDFEKLHQVLLKASQEIKKGNLRSISMIDLAQTASRH